MPIPAWSTKGVIAPIDIANPTSRARSPYLATLEDLIQRFATSQARCDILNGFLQYRAALHTAGMVAGFQWLDGSFLEDVETLESRNPQDLDVVTYFVLARGVTQADLVAANSSLFPADKAEHDALKARYKVDAYTVNLALRPDLLVRETTYWYSMWSHRRNESWKGYVQVNLAQGSDANAGQLLAATTAGLTAPAQNPAAAAPGGGTP